MHACYILLSHCLEVYFSYRQSGPYLEVGYDCDGDENRLQDCSPTPLFSRGSQYYLALQCKPACSAYIIGDLCVSHAQCCYSHESLHRGIPRKMKFTHTLNTCRTVIVIYISLFII